MLQTRTYRLHTILFAPIVVGVFFCMSPVGHAREILAAHDTTKSVLILHNDGTSLAGDTYHETARVFGRIIASHWDVTVTTRELTQVESTELARADVVIIANDDGIYIPQPIIDTLRAGDAQTAWFGPDALKAASLLASDITITHTPPRPLDPDSDYLLYEEQRFSVPRITFAAPSVRDAGTHQITTKGTLEGPHSTYGAAITAVDGRHLFFAFDLPAYFTVESYTLPLLDMFHMILGPGRTSGHALVRLEDINPHTYRNPATLERAFDVLATHDAPAHLAFFPRYVNPLTGTTLDTTPYARFTRLIRAQIAAERAILIQHGYTHQYGDEVSGVGYELWDAAHAAPRPDDGPTMVKHIVTAGATGIRDAALPVPDIWETPHYAASDEGHITLDTLYAYRYEHIPHIGELPFPVLIDGTIYIPENLGYVFDTPDIDAIKDRLDQLAVFDSAMPSFFWHPWRDAHELDDLLTHIRARGYVFADAYTATAHLGARDRHVVAAHTALQKNYDAYARTSHIIDGVIGGVFIFFLCGLLLALQNHIRIRRYVSRLDCFHKNITSTYVSYLFEKHQMTLPHIAIFVPARGEGLVIENTIRRLAKIDYPKDRYSVVIITDERETEDTPHAAQTRTVARRVIDHVHHEHGHNFIYTIDVPTWYSGVFGSTEKTYERSTKGRALNYALQSLQMQRAFQHVDFIGVLDADGRLHKNALKELASRYVTDGHDIYQGPVFQLSNINNVNLIGIMAGIELLIHHMTTLASRLHVRRRMPFLAGTNYFIKKDLIYDIGGWDQHALVEDAELALRAYLERGTIAGWLSVPEIEQTPPNFSVYRKQRERWARGHYELVGHVFRSRLPLNEKLHILWDIAFAQFRFLLDIGISLLAIIFLVLGFFADLPFVLRVISVILILGAVFIWDTYGYAYRRTRDHIGISDQLPRSGPLSIKLFFLFPFLMLIQAIPRIQALGYFFQKEQKSWYKTARTQEAIIE